MLKCSAVWYTRGSAVEWSLCFLFCFILKLRQYMCMHHYFGLFLKMAILLHCLILKLYFNLKFKKIVETLILNIPLQTTSALSKRKKSLQHFVRLNFNDNRIWAAWRFKANTPSYPLMTWLCSKEIFASSGFIWAFLDFGWPLKCRFGQAQVRIKGKSMVVSTSSSSLVLKQLFKALSFETTLEYSLHVSCVPPVTPTNHKKLGFFRQWPYFTSPVKRWYILAHSKRLALFHLLSNGFEMPLVLWEHCYTPCFWEDFCWLDSLVFSRFCICMLELFPVVQWAMLDLLISWSQLWCAWFCFLFS